MSERVETAVCAICGRAFSLRRIGGAYPRSYARRTGPVVTTLEWICSRPCDESYRHARKLDRPQPIVSLRRDPPAAPPHLGGGPA